MSPKRNRPFIYIGDGQPHNYIARLMWYAERFSLDEETTTNHGGCQDDHR